MKVVEARTDGVDYLLHVHRNEPGEVLSEPKIEEVLKELGIEAKITVTGHDGIHIVVMTSNAPSIEKIQELCKRIPLIETTIL